MIKSRTKIFFQTKEKIFNNRKILKLKKKKWRFFKKYKNLEKSESLKKRYKQKLLEKQKFLQFYGFSKNYQLKKFLLYFKNKNSLNLTYDLCIFLEKRLDVILYRLNFFKNIHSIKSLINKKHIYINNKRINHIYYNLKPGDFIFIDLKYFEIKILEIPPYLEWNKNINSIIFIRDPKVNEISFPFKINLNLALKFLIKK